MPTFDSSLFPLELINQFARGNGSVFVGAGLSRGAGLPSWAELVEPLALQVQGSSRRSLPDIAEDYEVFTSRPSLLEHVEEALDRPRPVPTEAHRKLVNLPVQRIFTTNFDSLLEEACKLRGLKHRKIVNDQQLGLMDNSKKMIIKLHGDIDSPETIIATSHDYEIYLKKHPGIANLLGLDLHTRTVLFLGYSFSDFHMRMILSQISNTPESLRRKPFTLQLNPTLNEENGFRQREINVINLRTSPEQGTQALADWLDQFTKLVRESPVRQLPTLQLFTTIGYINGNLPSPPKDEPFLGREVEHDRVMKGLKSRYPLVSIKGFAGVGKTSLAIQVAQACSPDRNKPSISPPDPGKPMADPVIFEYIVWISAKDQPERRRWLDHVLNEVARVTKNSAITQEQEKQERLETVGKTLECYKTLIMLDNFETMEDDPELIEWLEAIPSPSKVLFTTREGRPEREPIAAWTVYLKGLELPNAKELLRKKFPDMADQTLSDLADATDGNPQLIKLALGMIQERTASPEELVRQLSDPEKDLHEVFQKLFLGSWRRLSEPARQILRVTPLFGVSSISEEALRAAAGLLPEDFDQGSHQCLRFGLLELEKESGRYQIHPMTRAFARHRLNSQRPLRQKARRRCTEHFLGFIRRKVKRDDPEPQYWNALVRVEMVDALDPEWPSIRQVLTWADEDKQDQNLVELVMLLVHYMDTQFLNLERLEYVNKAILALRRLACQANEPQACFEQEALLRIDALGWTYVEVLELKKAEKEIGHGLEITQDTELQALGLAWMARVKAERKDFVEADQKIQQAFGLIDRCRPWIRFRLNMAKGDIALKQDRPDAQTALDSYLCAAREADRYGGEGGGYQIGPRIGLAYLERGRIEEAERTFKEELSALEKIPIGKLYAEYGLALVERKRRNLDKAQAMLSDVKAKLARRTKSNLNLLLRLIEEQEARI